MGVVHICIYAYARTYVSMCICGMYVRLYFYPYIYLSINLCSALPAVVDLL